MRGIGTWAAAASVAAMAMTGLAGESAAGVRFNLFYSPYYPGFEAYYGAPVYVPRARYRPYYEEDMPAYYFEREDDYYEPLYDPQYEPQFERPKKPVKKQAAIPAAKLAAKPEAEPKKTPVTLSCSKASKVVSGFGFSDVKPLDCKGQIYAFNAVRDGKKFAIKLNSVSGELAEVKKL